MLLSIGYGFGVDNWAFGVLIYKMLTGNYPFSTNANAVLTSLQIICQQPDLDILKTISENAYDLIEGLLKKCMTERLGKLYIWLYLA